MSTKTSIKRIALVAVSALGFGLLSVVPAKATSEQATSVVTDIILTSAATTVGLNANATVQVNVKHGEVAADNGFITIKAAVTSKPSASVATIGTTKSGNIAEDNVAPTASGINFTDTANSSSVGIIIATYTDVTDTTPGSASSIFSADGVDFGDFTVQGDKAGSYVLTVWHDANGNGTADAGEQSEQITITAQATPAANVAAAGSSDFGDNSAKLTFGTVAPVRAGTAFRLPVTIPVNAAVADGEIFDMNLTIDGGVQPSSSIITCADEEGTTYTAANCTNIAFGYHATDGDAINTTDDNGVIGTNLSGTGATSALTGYYWVKVDTAGTYRFTVSATDATGGQTITAAAPLSITTTGTPTSITLTPLTTSPSTDTTVNAGDEYGTSVIVELKDTNGNRTVLSATESLDVAAVGATGLSVKDNGTASATLVATDFNGAWAAGALTGSVAGGYAYFNLEATGAGTASVTVKGLNVVASTVTATSTVTFEAPDTDAASGDTLALTASQTGVSALGGSAPNNTATVATTKTSVSVEFTGAAVDKKMGYTLTDTSGVKYGIPGVYASGVKTLGTAGLATKWSVPFFAALAKDQVFTFAVSGTGAGASNTENIVFTGATSAINGTNSTFNVDTISSIPKGLITVTLTVKDQFGLAMAGQALTFTITGRNSAITTGVNQVTDANGMASFTYTDAGTSGADTIGVSGGSVTDTVTVTYNTADAVDSVTVEGPNTDEVVPTPQDISAGDGAQAGALAANTLKATVKNAAGSVLAGVPVTWTVSGTGAAVWSTQVTTYTNALGVATTRPYAWLAGKYTFTATSGAKSGTTDITFAQVNGQAEARTISATVTGNVVKATVKDRYGNPIASQDVYATRTGAGYFGNGAGSTSAKTDKNGEVEFIVSGGDATVTVALGSTSAADTLWGQSDAIKGNLDGALATGVLTAYVAGTTLVAEKGVGSSYDAAGVNSATVTAKFVDNAAVNAAAATAAAEAATAAAKAASEAAVAAAKAAGDAAVAAAAKAATDAVAAAKAAEAAAVAKAEEATDASLEAIDAANAATDAANLAAEAADAATVAAEEARDAADAATAAVEALASEVSTLIAGLKAQITTLANTVAKIAKKVRA